MDDLISVVIPIYNSEKYLKKCLESILKQTYKALEIILVNDGSTDQSTNICEEYCKRYHNIKYIFQENQGVSEARNKGIRESTGKYLAFIDSDDTISEDYFQVLYANMTSKEVDLSIVAIENALGNIMNVESMEVDFSKEDQEKFLILNKSFLLYGPVAKLYKREVVNKNNIEFPKEMFYGEDLIFNCQYLKYCNRLSYDHRATYFYSRDNQESLSQKVREDRFENELILCKALRGMFLAKGIYGEEYERYLEERIFDEGYNSVFDTLKDFSLSKEDKVNRINKIIKHERFQKAMDYIPSNKYSKNILCFMKNRHPRLLMMYFNLRK